MFFGAYLATFTVKYSLKIQAYFTEMFVKIACKKYSEQLKYYHLLKFWHTLDMEVYNI